MKFLLCRDHVWQPAAFVIAAAVAIATVVAAVPAVQGWFADDPITSEEQCQKAVRTSDTHEWIINYWYCNVQFANIWQPSRPTLLTENRPLVRQNLARIYGGTANPDMAFSAEALQDPGVSEGAKLSRIFRTWPTYRNRAAVVLGQVRSIDELTSDPLGAEWVVQLGSVREPSALIYVRLERSNDWRPAPERDCKVGLIEGVPIARGSVPRADGAGQYEVVYELGSTFICVPPGSPDDLKKFREHLPAELRAAFDDGADPDRW